MQRAQQFLPVLSTIAFDAPQNNRTYRCMKCQDNLHGFNIRVLDHFKKLNQFIRNACHQRVMKHPAIRL